MRIFNLKQCPETLPLIARWHHDEWACYNPGQTLDMRIDQMQEYLNQDQLPYMFVAIENDAIGSAAIVEHDMETHPELSPWLASVYVRYSSRGRGTGSLLVRHAMQHAQQSGLERLYLFTPDQQAFYERLGWGIFMNEYYHGHEVAIMHIDLNSHAQ